MTQTGSSRPTFVSSWQNGKPALDFDGSDDFMSSGANTVTMSSRCTGFVMADLDTAGGLFFENPASAGGTTGWYMGAISADLPIYVRREGSGHGPLFTAGSGWATTGVKVRSADYTASGPRYFVNGVEQANGGYYGSGPQSESDATRSMQVGGRSAVAHRINGRMAEVILYDGVLSDAIHANIVNYLKAKYGMI